MATVVLKPDPQRFPAGTTVKAYLRSDQPSVWDATGAPAGSAAATTTVAADGSVTFTGLADATRYVLWAGTPNRYVNFSTPAAPVSSGPSGPAGGVLAGTYPDPSFAVDMATQAELDASGSGWPASLVARRVWEPRATIVVTVNRLYAVRCRVPKSGTLKDISLLFNSQPTGNMRVGVYDTGQAAAGVRTRLYDSGSVAAPASTVNKWGVIVAEPALALVAGQQIDLCAIFDTAVTLLSDTATNVQSAFELPARFLPAAVLPKMIWQRDVGSFTLPATIAEALSVAPSSNTNVDPIAWVA